MVTMVTMVAMVVTIVWSRPAVFPRGRGQGTWLVEASRSPPTDINVHMYRCI
jgi:hypothetical protein